jgi:hypothetical protein
MPAVDLVQVYALCLECATEVWDKTPPSQAYATRVARQLFGTGIVESGWDIRRQRGPAYAGTNGGFGYTQVEEPSILASLEWLRKHPDAANRATQFLFADLRATPDWWLSIDNLVTFANTWLRALGSERMSILLCRLHYIRVPHAIPESLVSQAEEWLDRYNGHGVLKTLTGTPEERRAKAIERYVNLCRPELEKLQ